MRLKSHKTIMKHCTFVLILSVVLFQSCKKTELNDGIPSYINIPAINLMVVDSTSQGSDSHKITDAWVYFDNDLQGIYPLPTTFPVLKEGIQNISIKAGIKNNGIAATRANYPFYDFYKEEVYLKKDSITIINPDVKYFENTLFHIIDFESGSKIFYPQDSSTFLATNDTVFEGNSGGVHLASPHLTFEVTTEGLQLPKLGTPVYVELNYKCNTPFQIGVYADFSPTIVTNSIVTVNPKSEWNKIYVDLTSAIINTQQANNHKVFISMRRDVNSTEMATLYLDNFKVLY